MVNLFGEGIEAELSGVTKSNNSPAFKSDKIDDLFLDRQIVDVNVKNVDYFVLVEDPSYGGKCQTAIGVFYMDKKSNVTMCWLSGYSPKDYDEFTDFFYDNIKEFRKAYISCATKPIYIVYEQGSRWDASQLERNINLLGQKNMFFNNIYFIVDRYKKVSKDERTQKVPGITVNKQRLDGYVEYFSMALKYYCIYISKTFGTHSPEGIKPEKILSNAKIQLQNFIHFDENVNTKYDPNKKRNHHNSGKKGGEDDDLCIVIIVYLF